MTGSRLAALLDQATPGQPDPGSWGGRPYSPTERAMGYGTVDDPRMPQIREAYARLIALAPDMARLLVDMAAFISGDTPDDECDVPGCTDPWCCDHDAEALLARFAALDGKAGAA